MPTHLVKGIWIEYILVLIVLEMRACLWTVPYLYLMDFHAQQSELSANVSGRDDAS